VAKDIERCPSDEPVGSGGKDFSVSATSNGVDCLPLFVGTRVFSMEIPFSPLRGAGVELPEGLLVPSPSRTNSSTALSRLPLKPFRIVRFFFSSGNPISVRCASFIL